MVTPSFPIIRLRPKADARAIRHGFPWVYADQLVLDRRTKALEPGSLAILEDSERRCMGIVTFNGASKIAVRMLDRNGDAEINSDWFKARITAAVNHRERLYDAPFYRLVHAEADGLPGVIIDRFGDAAVIQPNIVWSDTAFDQIVDALKATTTIKTIVKNGTGRARKLEGLPEELFLVDGEIDGPLPVPMNGATYFADLLGGQKTGLFFDQRPNHGFVATLSKGAKVLDVFSHVGGFALAALAGGASHATSVDSSATALALAQKGAEVAGHAARFSTRQGDAFDEMHAMAQGGEKFDVVICDPPAFAPNKMALEKGLRAYERVARLAAALVEPGGYLGLCSCSHAATLTKFRAASVRGIGKAGRAAQIIHTGQAGPDHPELPQLAESGYLKSVFFRLLP